MWRLSTAHGGPGAVIMNLSSRASKLGSPGEYVDYVASRVAVEGIRVNAVSPGLIETDIHSSGGEPGRVERLKDSVTMGRGGAAEEVAQAVLWLLSDAASYTTGTMLDVSGGR